MGIYHSLSKIPFLKKYSYKFLFIAFLGIHIPLLGVIGFILTRDDSYISPLQIFILVLIFTLIATGITLAILNGLLEPINRAKDALLEFSKNQTSPILPTNYTDEAGLLLKNIHLAIHTIDDMVETQNELISLLSHDLRSPAASIISLCDVYPTEADEEKKHKIINYTQTLATNQLDMLDSLLHLIKYSSKDLFERNRENTELKKLITYIQEDLNVKASGKGINFNNEIKSGLEVYAHPQALYHALNNILTNAIKFSFEGTTIDVKITADESMVNIHISDKGIGLKPGTEEKIFEKFTEEGRRGTSNEPSTGFGLYITKKIIEAHNGNISAASEGKNKGTTISISIPAV